MTPFAQGLGFPEAPVLMPDGSFLLVEMSPDKGCVVRASRDGGYRTVLASTGRPNGLALDRAGFVWVAETAMRAVLKMKQDGSFKVHVRQGPDRPFRFLNDLAFAPNGDLYVTDSGVLPEEIMPGGELVSHYRSLKYDGRVYRIDAHSGAASCVDQGLEFANGIAFGPDEALYVAETLSGNIYRYAWRDGAALGRRELFGNVLERFDPAHLRGPDGMKFGEDGHLYVAVFGQSDVAVLDRGGRVVRRLGTQGSCPTNLAFAERGTRQIYVTEAETGTVQILDAGVDGYRLYG